MFFVGRFCGVRGDLEEDCSFVYLDFVGNLRYGVVVVGISFVDFLKCIMIFF